jgi:hypothetical protein
VLAPNARAAHQSRSAGNRRRDQAPRFPARNSVQQELRDVLERVAAEPIAGGRPRRLNLTTVATGHIEPFDRADFYDDDAR